MTVVAIVPARDEADVIATTIGAIRAVPVVDAVLVVDDASADGTGALAERAGATVLRLERNLGKGGALEAGLEAARDADVVLLLDADLGETAGGAAALLAPVLEGAADMTVAALPKPPGSGGFGLVKRLARRGISRLGGPFDARAPLSGQRALYAAAMHAVRPLGFGYGAEVAMTIRALRAGLRVIEVPVEMTHKATGRDLAGFAHRGRQFVQVLAALRALRREKRRLP
jgi:glycosyltransferase involved in cell wall biosynthesis